jgi:hypothetical protein
MKIILALLGLLFLGSAAMAQQWECFSGTVACAPGSPNCTCSQVAAPAAVPAVPAAPACPPMTYWNGNTCQVVSVYIPPAPVIVNPYYWQHQLHPDHPH